MPYISDFTPSVLQHSLSSMTSYTSIVSRLYSGNSPATLDVFVGGNPSHWLEWILPNPSTSSFYNSNFNEGLGENAVIDVGHQMEKIIYVL